jgi:PBSX family phage terminase large subunit
MKTDTHNIRSSNKKTIELSIGYPMNDKNPDGKPLPTQEKFHKSKAKYRLCAGGFATGKTTTLCLEVMKELGKYPNNYGVLGRKDLGELKSTTLKEFLDICPEQMILYHNKSDRVIRLMNGSELYYMPLDDARKATEKIKSLNLGFVAIDQVEEIGESIFLAFQGRLRRLNSSRNFFATCNPAGHDWVWKHWKDSPPSKEYELFETTTLENIYLPKDYVNELLQYPEKWVKRYVYCSWDAFEGLVYSEFIEAKHKIPYYEPSRSEKFTVILDYGFRNPTAVLFAATDYDGVTRIYDEYYEPGRLIKDHAEALKKYKYFERSYKIADPSINRTEKDGTSIHEEFMKHGIYFNDANNNVSQGIDRVNTLFKEDLLLIGENCTNTLDEIGRYVWKDLKAGDDRRNEHEEPVKKDDHAMDDIRYLANYIQIPSRPDLNYLDPRMDMLKIFQRKLKAQQRSNSTSFMSN